MASQRPEPTNGSRLPSASHLPRSTPSMPPSRLPARKPSSNNTLPTPTVSPAKPGVLKRKQLLAQRELMSKQPPRLAPTRQEPPKQPLYTKSAMKQPEKVTRYDAQQLVDTLPPPNRIPLLPPSRTPSLVSGSSGSTGDSPRSHILRRKPSFGRTVGARTSPDSSSSSSRDEPKGPTQNTFAYGDGYSDAVFGISLPTTTSPALAHKSPIINLDEFAHPTLDTIDLPPPTPLYAITHTPSTGYSASPFSAASTPTTATCYSPALTSRTYSQPRQISPVQTRPPVNRQTTTESTATQTSTGIVGRQSSTSSGSTVRASEDGKPGKQTGSSLPRKSLKNTTMSSKVNTSHRVISPTKRVAAISPEKPKEYPEFSHLSNAAPLNSSMMPPSRPVRPSRDNTPDMNFNQTSPIIQSNMSSLPSSLHKRQSSSESRRVMSPPLSSIEANRPRFGIPRKSLSRNPSPSPTTGPGASMTSLSTRGMTPEPKDSDKSKTAPSPQSRFGLFKRKNDSQTSVAKEKPPPTRLRKPPPVAGTGHEVYGKFGVRGRSGSTTSAATNNSADRRSSSIDSGQRTMPSSRKNSMGSRRTSGMDEFVTDRLTPITLRGNGNAALPAVSIERRSEEQRPGTAPAQSMRSQISELSRPALQTAYSERPGTSTAAKDDSAADAKNRFNLSNLSSRRSSRRSIMDSKSSSMSSTDLGDNFHFPSHPAINPLERKLSEPSPMVQGRPSIEFNRSKTVEILPKPSPKPSKMWTFFQRTKTPVKREDTPAEASSIAAQQPRTMPHYAIHDAPSKIDMEELEKIMQEAEETSPDEAPAKQELEEEEEEEEQQEPMPSKHGNSILLPAPPQLLPHFVMPARPESPRVMLHPTSLEPPSYPPPSPGTLPPFHFRADEDTQGEADEPPSGLAALPKGSRLPQVGRIPRVVSRRDREKKPSISSFSRPFDINQPSPALQTGQFPDDLSFDGLSSARSPLSAVEYPPDSLENTHQHPHQQGNWFTEEVWNEYDDLLDLLSPTTPKTPHTGSSLGAPFHYTLATPVDQIPTPLPPPQTAVPSLPSLIRQVRFQSTRESQILAHGGNSNVVVTTPTSPYFLADLHSNSADRNSGRVSIPSIRLSSGTRFSLPASIRPISGSQQQPSPPQAKTKRDSLSIQLAEAQHMGFETMAKLRFSALMTSKWLSFGRVLFSDAHFGLKDSGGEARVLIIDGLGKDWSFYVALTYPNATVYNLGPDPPEPADKPSSGGIFQSLPNHRHFHYSDSTAPFPWPKDFFSAVVLRFPVVASESSYRFTLGECKRVLRPGGHIEVSVLDMDMLNMGNRGRRALRALKEHLHAQDPTVNLKSISDTMQRLIGRRGFENLNRCVVGVPAAGCIPSSKDASPANLASPIIGGSPTKESFVSSSSSTPGFNGMNGNRSIVDLLREKNMNNPPPPTMFAGSEAVPGNGNTGGQQVNNDADITRMVARVARWWHSRCYEPFKLATGDVAGSIWSDTELLKECEERGSSLRLMVCVAQKPECTVRRTISV